MWGNSEPPRRERLGETLPHWLSSGCVSPTRWCYAVLLSPHCACVRSLRSRPQRLSVGLLRFNLSEVVKHPSNIFVLIKLLTQNLPTLSTLHPPTSYIIPSTSYVKHHTSYIAHHTSSTPLPHWCIPSYSPLTSLLLNASFFQRHLVSVYPIFLKHELP